jgi:plastocyanin
MTVVGAGCWAITVGLAYLILDVAPPYAQGADNSDAAVMIPMFVSITVIFAVIGAASMFWSGARRRPWFWLLAIVFALLVLALNLRHIPYDITHPANTSEFFITIVVVPGALAAIAGGIAAFLEVRRGRPIWTRSGRAGWVSVAVIGVLMGAAITSLLAGLASAGAAGVAEVPTVTGVMTAENFRFVESILQVRDGEVLGLFVVNNDDIGHSFDIDSLDIHVELPPNSTTAVAIQPTGLGNLEFFCSVPGHREAGMVGMIIVG